MRSSKFSWLLLVFVFGLLALVIGSAETEKREATPAKPPSPPGAVREIEVDFQVSLDELAKKFPGKLMLYRCAPDPTGEAQSRTLKGMFGEKAHMEIHRASGGVFAADLTRLWAKPPKFGEKVAAPDEGKTLAAGEAFLTKIKGLPEEKTKAKSSIDTAELKDREGKKQTLPMATQVTYRRVLMGYDVVGPGGKIKIYQDLQGKVLGYLRVWRKLIPEQDMPLITVTQAAEQFKKSPLGGALFTNVVRVEVKDIRLAYLERSIAEPQGYLQPIFLFDCVAHLKLKERIEKIPYARYVEALIKPPEPLFQEGQELKSIERPRALPKPGKDEN